MSFACKFRSENSEQSEISIVLRIILDSLFAAQMIWRQNRSGVTPSRLPDYLGHEFLVRMYICIRIYAHDHHCYCILQIFHESMR